MNHDYYADNETRAVLTGIANNTDKQLEALARMDVHSSHYFSDTYWLIDNRRITDLLWYESIQPAKDSPLVDVMIPAVYFIYYRDELTYIGQSKGLANRISYHITRAKYGNGYVPGIDVVDAIWTPIQHLDELEDYYIKKLRPTVNG